MKKVQAVEDQDGHWYVIPNELAEQFHADQFNDEFCASGEFDNKYGEYRTGGDLNNTQLYAEI